MPLEHSSTRLTWLWHSATKLDAELWALQLPHPCEITDTGDRNTPAVHHLLLAEAYVFANLFQLYQHFPKLLERRRETWTKHSSVADSELEPEPAHGKQWMCLLSSSQAKVDSNELTTFFGRSVVERLEQIPISSGTACIHPLLLLVGSTSLSTHSSLIRKEEGHEVLGARASILHRLFHLESRYPSRPTHYVRLAVEDIFARLDQGVEVVWMEALECMGLVTVIG